MSSIIVAHGVSYELPDGRKLFSNLDFALDARLTALVGPNGVGKTCLARILAGDLEPTQGVVRRNGPVKLLPQRQRPASITVAEFLSGDYEWSLHGERLLGNIDCSALCTTLSGGQWMRARLARAPDHDFLILDEPTNDLDRDGRNAVAQFLQARAGGALMISHDREGLKSCEAILELSKRGLAKFGGGWSAYAVAKERERERLQAALELARRRRDSALARHAEQQARQEKRNRRGADSAARGGVPRMLLGARRRRAQATSGALDAETAERYRDAVRAAHQALSEIKIDPVMYADLDSGRIPVGKLVAEAHGFNIRFRDWIYDEDLDFTWRGNVRVALRGANGAGKTTLLKALLGGVFTTRGELRRGDLSALYVDQNCGHLDDEKSVYDTVLEVSSASRSELRNGLARFLFANGHVFRKVGELSGGERLRAAFARGFLGERQPDLLVLDEPTNSLDLENVAFLERIVREFQGALVVVSHDEGFLGNCGVSQELILRAPTARSVGR